MLCLVLRRYARNKALSVSINRSDVILRTIQGNIKEPRGFAKAYSSEAGTCRYLLAYSKIDGFHHNRLGLTFWNELDKNEIYIGLLLGTNNISISYVDIFWLALSHFTCQN